jgi:hypothetical protein
MYTRKVYLEYRETFTKSTTFRMEPNPAVRNGYLVKHQRGGDEFCWANHAFRVHADVENGEYRCECRQWEHTGNEMCYMLCLEHFSPYAVLEVDDITTGKSLVGLFCMHLVKAFTQLQIDKIPNKYILKRYSRDARSVVEWDRNDMVKGGREGNPEQMRFAKLVPVVMGIARAGSKSEYASDEALKQATTLRDLIETIPPNVTTASPMNGNDTGEADEETPSLAILAATFSQPKGRATNRGKQQNESSVAYQSTSTYKRKRTASGKEVVGDRTCGTCNLRGHYSTTCPLNPNRSRAAEKRGTRRGGIRRRGRPRTKRCSSEEGDEERCEGIFSNVVDDIDDEECQSDP